jgi:TRAP-type C4-dicarboxylate transport system permease small subunit
MKALIRKLLRESYGAKRRLYPAALAIMALAVTMLPLPAFAQSCALCYTQAASSSRQMIEALRSGILILIIPPTLGTIVFLFIVRHKRNQIRRTDVDSSHIDW